MMRNRKKSLIAIAIVITLLTNVMCGCNAETSVDGKPYVAFIVKSTESAFWKSVYAGANAASSEYNVDITFEGPEFEEDSETQNEYVHEALEAGADIIVLSATDYDANIEAVSEAIEQNVEVVVIDSNVNSEDISCYIGTNNYMAGVQAAASTQAINEEELYIGIVNYGLNSYNGQERERGFREGVVDDDRVKEIFTVNVVSTTEEAKKGTLELLKEHPEINVIITLNEWTSLGVGYAVKELGIADSTYVVAFDSNVVSVGMLETGEVDALVVQNPYAMGYLGVEKAYELYNKKSVEDQIDTSTILVNYGNMYTEESQKMLFPFTQ